jgi:hypothetical protein
MANWKVGIMNKGGLIPTYADAITSAETVSPKKIPMPPLPRTRPVQQNIQQRLSSSIQTLTKRKPNQLPPPPTGLAYKQQPKTSFAELRRKAIQNAILAHFNVMGE